MLQPTIEKIFEDLELISRKELLLFNRPILQQIYDDDDNNKDKSTFFKLILEKRMKEKHTQI